MSIGGAVQHYPKLKCNLKKWGQDIEFTRTLPFQYLSKSTDGLYQNVQ